MLFNSYIFIFLFCPITFIGFYLFGARGHHRLAIFWLVGASLFFYGWWNPLYLIIIVASILVNYQLGLSLGNHHHPKQSTLLLGIGIAANLGLIGYFKYANFFLDTMNGLLGSEYHLGRIILPLGISFFTFQQIAYLIDAHRGETREYSFIHYCLFVTFFPQLIAGPIVHHKEMLPQFAKVLGDKFNQKNLSVGLTIFTFGLFKKVIIADTLATYATPVFTAAEQGITLTFFEAWCGALAYTFQLYFDFSGYSDMAIGLGRIIGIYLPLNFNSPYKAVNIIDFWQRWHITLSRFLRDYLYIPLGGNRKGRLRQYGNLVATMLLGGLWHGAGWTFIFWGALHGLFLATNHAWHHIRHTVRGGDLANSTWFGKISAQLLTFLVIVLSWVVFRSESFESATSIWQSMVGFHGISFPRILRDSIIEHVAWIPSHWLMFDGMFPNNTAPWAYKGMVFLLIAGLLTWTMPNVAQIMGNTNADIDSQSAPALIRWNNSMYWATGVGLMLGLSILGLGSATEFLYFQF